MRLEPSARYHNLTVVKDRGFRAVECRCRCGSIGRYDRSGLVHGRSTQCNACRLADLSERQRKLHEEHTKCR